MISRTIGGHIFSPAHQVNRGNTINQIRGGVGIFNRIDITLAELKKFYETKFDGEAMYYKPLYDTFKRYQCFFEIFETFENYIDIMQLEMFLLKVR
nr:hypothetical protein [Cellulosilyticum ruminicola]